MSERDYIERTIETIRIHRDADNCWPQWANLLADEVEAGWAERDALAARVETLENALREERAETGRQRTLLLRVFAATYYGDASEAVDAIAAEIRRYLDTDRAALASRPAGEETQG